MSVVRLGSLTLLLLETKSHTNSEEFFPKKEGDESHTNSKYAVSEDESVVQKGF